VTVREPPSRSPCRSAPSPASRTYVLTSRDRAGRHPLDPAQDRRDQSALRGDGERVLSGQLTPNTRIVQDELAEERRRAFTRLTADQRRWIISAAEHHLLIEALRDRDQQSAPRILELHIRRTRVELSRHPEVFQTGPIGS
jgi:hypothetical protein